MFVWFCIYLTSFHDRHNSVSGLQTDESSHARQLRITDIFISQEKDKNNEKGNSGESVKLDAKYQKEISTDEKPIGGKQEKMA